MPMHSLLSVAPYLDQFCFSVSCAVVSSARQASLLRPRMTAPRAAASQLGPTLSVGEPPALARAVCPLTHVGECLGVDDVIVVAGAQQREEVDRRGYRLDPGSSVL
jgi:hypothetical protein